MTGSKTTPESARIEIRPAEEADVEAILRLYALPEFDNGRTLPPAAARERFARTRLYPDYRFYVCAAEGRIVGTYSLLVMEKIVQMGAVAGIVDDVIVEPSWRGQGIGTRMMRDAMARCREKGCYKMALSTNVKRAEAHRFYESLGFVRHGYSFIVELP